MHNSFQNCVNLRTVSNLYCRPYLWNYYVGLTSTFSNCPTLQYLNDMMIYNPTMSMTFYNCTNLVGFNNCNFIPGSVGLYAPSAFTNCYNLTNLPDSLLSNGLFLNYNIHRIFANCYNLSFPNEIKLTISQSSFHNYTSNNVFCNCKQLRNLTLKQNSAQGGTFETFSWFEECSNLETLTLTNCTNIKFSYAFDNCNKLQYVYLNNSILAGSGIFQNCGAVTNVQNIIKSSQENYTVTFTSGDYLFANCENLVSTGNITVSSLYCDKMFYNCSNLKDISGLNITTINRADSMFYNCSNLREIHCIQGIGNSYVLMNSMVYGCSNLTSLQALEMRTYNAGTTAGACIFGPFSTIINNPQGACKNLVNFGGFLNYGMSFANVKTTNSNAATLDIVGAPRLSYKSILNVTTNLANLYNVYKVANGGTLYSQLIRMSNHQYEKLSATDITNIQNLGWNISVHNYNIV